MAEQYISNVFIDKMTVSEDLTQHALLLLTKVEDGYTRAGVSYNIGNGSTLSFSAIDKSFTATNEKGEVIAAEGKSKNSIKDDVEQAVIELLDEESLVKLRRSLTGME